MARNKTKLLGFRQPKRSSSASTTGVDGAFTDAQQVSYYSNLYKASIGGDFRNSSDIEGYIQMLSSMPQTPEVQIEIAKAQVKGQEMDNNQKQIFNSIASLKDKLNDDLRSALTQSNGDLNRLLSSQAGIYSEYADRIDQFAADTLENYNTNTQLDQSFYDFKTLIEDQAANLSGLSAQVNDPNQAGTFDPEALSIQITTNPNTGTINNVEFIPRGSINNPYTGEKNIGYVETDVGFKVNDLVGKIPVSINAIDNGSTSSGTQKRMARLGDIKLFGTFSKSAKDDQEIDSEFGLYQLKAQDSEATLYKLINGSTLQTAKANGFTLDQFKVSGNDIPANSVIRRGSKLFFAYQDGTLQEFSGENYSEKSKNAYDWMSKMGYSNPYKAYYPLPASEEYLSLPDGAGGRASRVRPSSLDPKTSVNPLTTPSFQTPIASSSVKSTNPIADVGSSFFGDRVNRLNKPDQAAAKKTSDIIDKGNSFFRTIA